MKTVLSYEASGVLSIGENSYITVPCAGNDLGEVVVKDAAVAKILFR